MIRAYLTLAIWGLLFIVGQADEQTEYIDAYTLQHSLGFTAHSDPITKHQIFKGKCEFICVIGMRAILVNHQVYYLDNPVILRDGRLLIPCEAIEIIRRCEVTLKPFKVVIDPGHGGKFKGAHGKNGLHEKDIVLDISLRLKSLLVARGINVIMTRQDDTHLSEDWRQDLRRRVQISEQNLPDLFISIHVNSHTDYLVKGFEIYIPPGARPEAQVFARTLLEILDSNLRTSNRGIKRANFYVLKNNPVPSVLVEGGFISNPEDRRELYNPSYRQKLAELLADAIDRFRAQKR
jgi:N-acetylmuramoyl-L-alanine amidase CwlD